MRDGVAFCNDQPVWMVLNRFSESLYLMALTVDGVTRDAPLCILSFMLAAPYMLLEAQRIKTQYPSYSDIETIPDKLRWCRHHMGLTQEQAADKIGVSREAYVNMETGRMDHLPKEIVDKLAALYQIPSDDLLDDCSRFIYRGQGKMTRAYREALGLGKRSFARLVGTNDNCVRAWEAERKRLTRSSWEKYYRDIYQTDGSA